MNHNELEATPRWVVPMKPRSPEEAHRVSTPLELFFDLVFVVAVASAGSGLHHGIAELHTAQAIASYLMMFFGIWWAWMNFTWFASAYDTDDIPYRLTVFVQMTGALIFAAGVERVFAEQDLSVTVVGYVVMRVAAITQWLRAAQSDPQHRPAALRYALGVGLCQVGWVLLLALPAAMHLIGFIALAFMEILVPVWAEQASPTPWHEHHIVERYGLFTIIVLGESILSAMVAVQSTLEAGVMNSDLVPVIIGGLLIVYAAWWLYFYQPAKGLMTSLRGTFIWGYGHLFIFAAVAAGGAGLAVTIDQVTHHSAISAVGAGFAAAIPAAVYLVSLWAVQDLPRATNIMQGLLFPAFALLILLTPFTGQAVLLTGILLSALVAIRLIRHMA
jgi:low temperature requirement protein LtrA